MGGPLLVATAASRAIRWKTSNLTDTGTLRVDKIAFTMYRLNTTSLSAPSLAQFQSAESSHVAAVLGGPQKSITSCRPRCLSTVVGIHSHCARHCSRVSLDKLF